MDRNDENDWAQLRDLVALRKESVDRNNDGARQLRNITESLSARRAWIEIKTYATTASVEKVALRKESVDRNVIHAKYMAGRGGRSPQGERG